MRLCVEIAFSSAPGICAIGVALLLWGAVLLFPVYVSKEGLRSYTLWGDYRTIPWNRIDTIRPINFLGLRYLRAGTRGEGAPVWVPLWLSDKGGEITRLAGLEHPLVKAWNGRISAEFEGWCAAITARRCGEIRQPSLGISTPGSLALAFDGPTMSFAPLNLGLTLGFL